MKKKDNENARTMGFQLIKAVYMEWSQLQRETECAASGRAGRVMLSYELLARKATLDLNSIQKNVLLLVANQASMVRFCY